MVSKRVFFQTKHVEAGFIYFSFFFKSFSLMRAGRVYSNPKQTLGGGLESCGINIYETHSGELCGESVSSSKEKGGLLGEA